MSENVARPKPLRRSLRPWRALAACLCAPLTFGCAQTETPISIDYYELVKPETAGAGPCPVTWENMDSACRPPAGQPMLPPVGTVAVVRFSEPRVSIDGLQCFTNVCVSRNGEQYVFYYKDEDVDILVATALVGLIRRAGEPIGFVLMPRDRSLGWVHLAAVKYDDSALDVLRSFPSGR